MKAFLISLLLCGSACAAPAGAEDVAKLLDQLPPHQALRAAQDMIVGPEGSPPRAAIGKSPAELAAARELIEKAKEIIPKVRALLVLRSSVFDYPGLIAHGEITWLDYRQEYEIYLGVYLRGSEGRGPYDFKIVVDRSGVITAVKDAVWKR